MTIDHVAPRRMSIANLNSGQVFEAQFNPSEIEEQLSVNWQEQDILGLSHKPLQYKNTSNHQFKFTMRLSAMQAMARTGNTVEPSISIETHEGEVIIKNARNFLLSLCYGPRGAQDVVGGSPPRLLFFWPALASIEAVIFTLKIKHTQFSKQAPALFDVDVMLKEIRDVRLVSEDVLENGTIRSGEA